MERGTTLSLLEEIFRKSPESIFLSRSSLVAAMILTSIFIGPAPSKTCDLLTCKTLSSFTWRLTGRLAISSRKGSLYRRPQNSPAFRSRLAR